MRPEYRKRAEKTIESVVPLIERSPTAAPQMAVALRELLATQPLKAPAKEPAEPPSEKSPSKSAADPE